MATLTQLIRTEHARPAPPVASTPLVDMRPGILYRLWAKIHHPVYYTHTLQILATVPGVTSIRRILAENGYRREDGWELVDWNAGVQP